MTRKTLIQTAGGTAVGLVAVVMIADMVGRAGRVEAQTAGGSNAAGAAARAVSVVVTQAERRPLTRMLKMPATLVPIEMADLYAKTSGYVTTVKVDIGDRVASGQALLVIDVPEMADDLRRTEAVLAAKRAMVRVLTANVAQADSAIATAAAERQRAAAEHDLRKITFSRQERLRQQNAIPEQTFDEAKSQLAIADARVKIAAAKIANAQARKQAVEADVEVARAEVVVAEATAARLVTLMNYATVRAPFAGLITARLVDPGAFVRSAAEGATGALLSIAKVDRLRLVLEIPESDAAFVDAGTEVEIVVRSLGDDPIQAAITRTAGVLKANTRTMRAEVELDNADGRLKAGMYAQVSIKLETKQQALMIPSQAIRVRGRELSVMVAEGAVAQSVPVTIGYDDGIWVEVTAGLNGGEDVIVSAAGAVATGTPVAVSRTGSSES
ncbi:MAG: efflux RND transporter periplasmic adaptor subunit [Planctomycetes bacterium]|nr:efflux RND transporter periplasmic adaptor subunit [Planctomycetota bacterium]